MPTQEQLDFVDTYGPLAKDISQATGLDPSLVLGHAAQESGWGKKMTGNNLFGISPSGPQGQSVAQYPDVSSAAQAYVDLVNSRYKVASSWPDPKVQGLALGQLGYNKTPGYGEQLGNMAGIVRGLMPADPLPTDKASAILQAADSTMGMNGAAVQPFLNAHGQTLDATKNNWCAAWTNGVLNEGGVTGTEGAGRNVATSFLNWGSPVRGAPAPGDVLVMPQGHAAGQIGGHVGVATGNSQTFGDKPYYEMASGNYRNGQSYYSWEPASSLVVRRGSVPGASSATPPTSPPPPAAQAQAQGSASP